VTENDGWNLMDLVTVLDNDVCKRAFGTCRHDWYTACCDAL